MIQRSLWNSYYQIANPVLSGCGFLIRTRLYPHLPAFGFATQFKHFQEK